jgi:hypothetical protein
MAGLMVAHKGYTLHYDNDFVSSIPNIVDLPGNYDNYDNYDIFLKKQRE